MSDRFRTNYKDEIPIGEVRLYDMIDENGAYIGKGVKLVRANGNLQEGDTFSSLEVNSIFECLNGLFDGSEVVAKANHAKNADNATKANDADKISRLGLDGGYLPVAKDCLSVLTSENGKLEQANNYSEGTKNCPVTQFIGTKQQFVMADGWGIVILHEMHPVPKRIWMNAYNQEWRGWQCFSDDISVINAAVAQAVEYLNVHGMNIGSASNPNRPINFFSSDGTYYQLHSNGGAFWIHKFNASNQVIALPLYIDGNGNATVQYAREVPWSGVSNKPFTEIKFLTFTINAFANSSTIYGRVSVGTQWNGCKVFVSNRFATSTPCNQVNNIVGAVLNGTLEVDAYGAFVNGHMLSVDVLLMR